MSTDSTSQQPIRVHPEVADDPRTPVFCRDHCKAKCCVLHDPYEPEPVPCPRLLSDHSCGVYRERYGRMGHEPVVSIGTFRSKRFRDLSGMPTQRPFFCGRIVELLQSGQVRPEVAAGCCYQHPHLLEQVESKGKR